jgi:CheY-like chemotaxis protein
MSKILLVEDSPTQALQIQMMLEELEHQVTAVTDGRSAVDALRSLPWDLVVTDLELPELNGLELVDLMKKEFPMIPAILVTAKGSEELAVKALRQGAAGYVPKSKLGDLMVETVEHVLGSTRSHHSYASLVERLDETEYRFTLTNDPTVIGPLVDFINQMVAGMRILKGAELVRLAMAIEHAILNGIYRGNLGLTRRELPVTDNGILSGLEPPEITVRRQSKPYADRRVRFHAYLSRQEVRITVDDDGPGFDTSLVPACSGPESLESEGGRGLVMMASFMDGLAFNTKGNSVTMVKRAS